MNNHKDEGRTDIVRNETFKLTNKTRTFRQSDKQSLHLNEHPVCGSVRHVHRPYVVRL